MNKDVMYRKATITAIFMALIMLQGCFKDLGNYEYKEINDIIISDEGFDREYDCRISLDNLVIRPEITFTLDPEETGSYSYEWVAVGQNFQRGRRFVIGKERNLDYNMKLTSDEYILYFKVKDEATGIVSSKDVPLKVRSNYSRGWLLGGTGEDGTGQVDMMSISSDTLFIRNTLIKEEGLEFGPVNIVWVDNNEWTSDDRVYVAADEGTWKFDRTNFNATPYTGLKYSFAFPPENGSDVMTDCQSISDKRHVIIVDGLAYQVSTSGGTIQNTFSFYQDDELMKTFRTGPRTLCNHKHQDVRMFLFYDEEQKQFCYISGLNVKGMRRLGDGEGDRWSWNTRKDFPEGLEMKTVVNSFFGAGQSVAIMVNPLDGKHYLYCTTPNNSGIVSKEGRYEVGPEAQDFAGSPSFAVTANHGYMLYASGDKLYGYDFRKQPKTCTLIRKFDAPVCHIMADIQSPESFGDYVYVATYDDQDARSGKLYKFQVKDNPDRIELEEKEVWDKGLLKISSMFYKEY